MRLFRVPFYREDAAPQERGGLLYVPPRGSGRIDNPDAYDVLYVGDTAAGVCAEVFYRGQYRVTWTDSMLKPLPSGDRRVLAWYELPDEVAVCNLNDPAELVKRHLRPSDIITRDLAVTQGWALSLYGERRYAGVAWWSYCDSRWLTFGLWDREGIAAHGFDELSLSHPAMQAAANVLQVTF